MRYRILLTIAALITLLLCGCSGNSSPKAVSLDDAVGYITDHSEWPEMAEITDGFILNEFFGIDTDVYPEEDIAVYQCPMSAVMSEIILIRSDDLAGACAVLEARREKAITIDAFYPEDKAIAEASVVGTEGDIAYFIMGSSADESERLLTEYLR